MNWHAAPLKSVLKELNTSEKGLSSTEVAIRLKAYGHNKLKEKPPKPWFLLLFAQFNNFLIWILILAALVSFALGEVLDAAAIMAIVVVFAFFGFYQEYRAGKAIEALKRLAVLRAVVYRDGREQNADSSELVPGDVIALMEGARVPADCRLLEAYDLQVDEAALTGESVPVSKDSSLVLDAKGALAERENMAFLGTVITRGRGKAVVVATGMQTELGKIAQLVQEIEQPPTPMQLKLEELGKTLGALALAAVVIIFVVGALRGIQLFQMFLTAVALAVAAVPEGLPAVVTITLAVGVTRMAKRNSLVRHLPAVETLGSTTVICTDKTGTLTKNEMTVRLVCVDGEEHEVTGSGFLGKGEVLGRRTKALERLLEASVLCNSSSLTDGGIVGDPTEAALLVLGRKGGLEYEVLRQENKLVDEIPFSSERKLMSTVHAFDSEKIVFSKGAPEVLIEKCTRVFEHGEIRSLKAEEKRKWLKQNEAYAAKGLRVLGFAFKPLTGEIEEDLAWLGLAALNDPPRPEAKEAVASCVQAGVRVVMITGDNPLTAKTIAQELGLPAERVLTGRELDELPDFFEAVRKTSVFARVSPEHKLNIVKALKAQGHVVAVTGDGVNDAPAIKAGDIGVAMGITGTDVTKETSAMIITDDNFASIVAAVEEGRTVYDNIVKSVTYLISCNVGEVLTVLFALLAGLGNPLAPLQILWMNLATDLLPAAALSFDPRLPDAMQKPPRKQNEPVFTHDRITRALAVGALMTIVTLALYGFFLPQGQAKAVTVAFTTLIFCQLFFAFSSRSEKHTLFSLGAFKNKYLWAAIAASALLQLAVVQLAPLQPFFETVGLSAREWLLSAAVALAPFAVVESLKSLKKW